MTEILSLILAASPKIFEPMATLLSCFGAFVVSRHGHGKKALIGWQAWLAAGVLWISFAAFNGHWFMAVTQAYFFYTATIGHRNTILNVHGEQGS